MDIVQAASGLSKSTGISGNLLSLAPIVIIIVIFYLFLILPQQRKSKALREKLSSIQVGNKVLTNSGMVVVIHKIISADYLEVELSDNVYVVMRRNAIVDINPNVSTSTLVSSKKK